jgi:hypothetical protein
MDVVYLDSNHWRAGAAGFSALAGRGAAMMLFSDSVTKWSIDLDWTADTIPQFIVKFNGQERARCSTYNQALEAIK